VLPPLPDKTMATLTVLKKKIAALEAQVERVAKAEMGNAIAKIRKLMGDYGVTIEHLMDGAKMGRAAVATKSAGSKKVKGPKAKRPAKYVDPKTGATWSGLGRIPAWIAKAKNRDAFLIDSPAAAEISSAIPGAKSSAKPGTSKKVRKVAGVAKTARKEAVKKSAPASKSTSVKKPVASKTTVSKKATRKQVPAKKVAAKAARKATGSREASAPAQSSAPAADAGTAAG
jgi:DNA-binding protein H-NS